MVNNYLFDEGFNLFAYSFTVVSKLRVLAERHVREIGTGVEYVWGFVSCVMSKGIELDVDALRAQRMRE